MRKNLCFILNELINNVNELIRLGKGDLGRLEHIKDTLQQNKTLYESDKEYLEKLSRQYLGGKPSIDETHYDQQNSSLFCFKCGKNLTSDSSFCPNCGIPQEKHQSKSFCGKCGVSLPNDARFCIECGYSISSDISKKENFEDSIKSEKPKKKGRSKKKKIGIGFGIFIAIIFVLGIIGLSDSNTTLDSDQEHNTQNTVTQEKTSSVNEIKSIAIDSPNYSDLIRNNESYQNKIVHYNGIILQVSEKETNRYDLVIGVNCDQYIGCQDLSVDYTGKRLLKGDQIELWGKIIGLQNVKNSFTNAGDVFPNIQALILDCVNC